MAKYNKRLAKKKKRQALEQKARQYGKNTKDIKNVSLADLQTIVSQERKKENQRKKYQEKKDKIKNGGLEGFMSASTSDKNWDKEWRKAKKKKLRHDKRQHLLNIPGINKDKVKGLSDSWFDKHSWTRIQNVTKDTAPDLFASDIVPPADKDTSKVYKVKNGLYIGYYSKDGSIGVGFLLSTFDFYASAGSIEILQKTIPDIIHRKTKPSDGKPGDTIILIDNTPGTWSMIEAYRALDYHDIILPHQKEFTVKSALALTCSMLEFARQDNRKSLYNDLKQYFKTYGNGLGKFFP